MNIFSCRLNVFFLLLLVINICEANNEKLNPNQERLNDRLLHVSEFWKKSSVVTKYKPESYLPIWFVDESENKLYLVFDKHLRFTADLGKVVGTLVMKNLDEYDFVLVPYKRKHYSNLTKAWEKTKAEVQSSDDVPIVLYGRNDLIFAIVKNINYIDSLPEIRGLCDEYYKSTPHICYLKNSAMMKKLGKSESIKSINNNDFRLLKGCHMEYDRDYGYKDKCWHSFKGFYSKEQSEVEMQFEKYGNKLRDLIFFDIGAYDLIAHSGHNIFIEEYNTELVKHLHSKDKIKTSAYDRQKADKIFSFIRQKWDQIAILILFSSFLLFAIYRPRFLWLVSFAFAQYIFILPIPFMYTFGFENLGFVLFASIGMVVIHKEAIGGVFKIWLLFLPYWFFTHLIIKRVISSYVDHDKNNAV